MYSFNFSETNSLQDKIDNQTIDNHAWFPAQKVVIPLDKFELQHYTDYNENREFSGIILKIVKLQNIITFAKENNYDNILEAEAQHSDLLTAKYEGGLKIWECTYDLGHYILHQGLDLDGKNTLDLGCGAGLIGIISLLRGAKVDFQDYNNEVITTLTIPNVVLNILDKNNIIQSCNFFSGDWEYFLQLVDEKDNEDYDFIFTSETIYNRNNYHKLYNIFHKKLKKDGIGLVAAKIFYFGVGGGTREFEHFCRNKKNNSLHTKVVWKSNQGVQREIIEIRKII